MQYVLYIAIIVSAIAVFSVICYFSAMLFASYIIYFCTMRRISKKYWARVQNDDDQEHIKMDIVGMAWNSENLQYKKDVHIVNDGYNLYGEYYDYGYDRAVIFLCGRPDSLRYAYFYTAPYSKNGFNVLVFDTRSHGESDGKFITFGNEEGKDALAWAKFLHDEHGVKSIVFHGICVGSAAGIVAITSPDCPLYIDALVTDGVFTNFGESMKNHLIERKRNYFALYECINLWSKIFSAHSMDKGPVDVIERFDKPILMLHSKADTYSVPENAQKLFDMCPSNKKRLVWFEGSRHSMIRFDHTKEYDQEVTMFMTELYGKVQSI